MKRTGGGRFDPAITPMYFLAGNPWAKYAGTRATCTLMALNDLIANPVAVAELQYRLDNGGKVLLDSGVFNLANQHAIKNGLTIATAISLNPGEMTGFAALRTAYVDMVKRHESQLWGYVELDQGTTNDKRQTRADLEAEGVIPMPVYHPLTDGWDYFDELASNYDRVCVSNLAQAPSIVRKRLLATIWERRRAYPDVWIHLLGFTPGELAGTLPFDSCDSSVFVGSLRFGVTATPYATSALKRMTPGDASYTYNPDNEKPLDIATAMLHAGSDHLDRAWRVQMREAAGLVDPVPAVEEWEPALR